MYMFDDMETGDVRTAVAVNEAAARFQLGAIWSDVECTTEFESCEIDGLPAIYRQGEADADAPCRAMVEANPILKGNRQVHRTRGAGAAHRGAGEVSQVRGAARGADVPDDRRRQIGARRCRHSHTTP
jgi:hypothetical protein